MRIKKFKNNDYVLAGDGVWVRNPYSPAEKIDINNLTKNDIKIFLENEHENSQVYGLQLDNLNEAGLSNVIICSDGFGWKDRQKVLGKIPNKLCKIIGVNGSLAKWEMVGEKAEVKRVMSFYLVNNPFSECLIYLPKKHRYYPNLIASTKTYPNFLKQYQNQPLFYKSTNNLIYSSFSEGGNLSLDDYRNPICASISFAIKRGLKKLVLFCCDEAFKENKPGSVKMKNGLYQYPQQIMCQKIIDKQLFWLKKAGVEIKDCSSGIEYENAGYIDSENLLSFFEEK
jgi:hypothetical protein